MLFNVWVLSSVFSHDDGLLVQLCVLIVVAVVFDAADVTAVGVVGRGEPPPGAVGHHAGEVVGGREVSLGRPRQGQELRV